MKLLVLSSFALLTIAAGLPLQAGEVTPAFVAERIAKDEGYQFFSFHQETAQPCRLVARFNGTDNAQNTLDLPAWKDGVVAVRLGKNNALEAVHVYSDKASMSMKFPAGHFPDFNNVISQLDIQIGDAFLTLHGTGGDLQLFLQPRKPSHALQRTEAGGSPSPSP